MEIFQYVEDAFIPFTEFDLFHHSLDDCDNNILYEAMSYCNLLISMFLTYLVPLLLTFLLNFFSFVFKLGTCWKKNNKIKLELTMGTYRFVCCRTMLLFVCPSSYLSHLHNTSLKFGKGRNVDVWIRSCFLSL
jgi:hypothetical protein